MHENSIDLEDCNLLNEPLNISDLLSKGSQFEISNDFSLSSMKNTEIFDDYGVGSDDEDFENEEVELSPWEQKFDELRASMTKVSDGIYKKIIKAGEERFGLPKENSRVVIEYSSFKEFDVKPVDSTFLRGTKQILNTGVDEIVSGLELAICSMKKGENAQFLISHVHLYGELGCPPRIPPKCELLFVVRLLDFSDNGDLNATDDVSEEDRFRFSVVYPKAEQVHKKGKDFFRLKSYEHAAKAFLKAVKALEQCRLANSSEEEKQKTLLKILYINLMVCFHKKDLPKKVCLMVNSYKRIDEKAYCNVKALYFEGQALFKLSEYDRARLCLMKAQRIEPGNSEINNALIKLAQAEAEYRKFQKNLCERTFGIVNDAKKDIKNKQDAIAAEIKKSLEEFKNDSNCTEMNFPPGLTGSECSAVEEIIKDINLKLRITAFGKKVIVKK